MFDAPTSTPAIVLMAWAWVFAYLAAYYGLLYVRRRADREYLAFGLLSAGVGLFSGANAFLLDANTLAEATLAQRISNVGLMLGVAFFIDFEAELRGARTRWQLAAYLWVVVGLAGEAAGVFFLDHSIEPLWAYGGRDTPMPALTNFGIAHNIGLLVVSAAGVFQLFRVPTQAPMDRRAAQFVGFAAAICMVCGTHDMLVRSGRLQAYPLLDHAVVLFVLAVSYGLLGRFVREGAELRERTTELAHALAELRTTQERLVQQEQLAAVGELSAVIAHEIRNPLAIIKNAASGLRRGSSEGDRATLLDILDEETDRLKRLMNDLLAYARPVVPQGRSLRVAELVKRSVERAVSGVTHAEQVEVVYGLDGPPHVHGDPELLRHALVNVVENALEAMQAGGKLEIRTAEARLRGQAAVRLSFTDSGEGMDTLVRGKARNPFFTTRPSGTGLGLAIVERVIRNHGGDVDIESRHGVGTTITFTLPCERMETT